MRIRVGEALRDVQVRGEVRLLAQDDRASAGELQPGKEQLIQVDGGAVGCYHLPGTGANEPPDLVADSSRRVDPTGRVPAAEKPSAPLVAHESVDAFHDVAREGTQRVPAHEDDAVREKEVVAHLAERILRVE